MKQAKDHIELLFGKENTPSPTTILAYLEGTLSPSDTHKVERVVSSDPFLSDALEGLEFLPPEERKLAVFNLIGKELKEPIQFNPRIAIAAAIGLILVGTVYLSTQLLISDENNVAQEISSEKIEQKKVTTPPKKPTLSTPIITTNETPSDSLVLVPEEDIVLEIEEEELELVSSNILLEEKDISNDEGTISRSIDDSESFMDLEEEPQSAPEILANEMMAEKELSKKMESVQSNQSLALSMIKSLRDNSHTASYQVDGSTMRKKADQVTEGKQLKKKDTELANSYALGVEAYNTGNYFQAVKRFNEVYKKSSSLGDVRYYLATSYLYGNNNIERAEKVFKMQNTSTLVIEKKWVQAMIYLNINKTGKAKNLLLEISSSSHGLNTSAKQLLNKL